MSKWRGTFDFEVDAYDLNDLLRRRYRYLFTDGKDTYEVYFEVEGEGYQEGTEYKSRGFYQWGGPSDPPESEIDNAGVTDYEFKYCDAYILDKNGEVISEDEPFHFVFIDDEKGIDLDNCGKKAKELFDTLRTKDRADLTITEAVEELLYEYCWVAPISDMDYDF